MLKRLFIILSLFLFSTCSLRPIQYVNPIKRYNDGSYALPIRSFVQIKKSYISTFCTEEEFKKDRKEQKNKCPMFIGSGYGSGAVIKRVRNGSLILTAAHVCDISPPGKYIVNAVESVYDIDFKPYNMKVFAIDRHNDLCIVFAKGLNDKPIVPIAHFAPKIGEKVYNIAAPAGLFAKNLVPIFDGYYLGIYKTSKIQLSLYSIFAAGGSSGSMVVDKYGRLIGMIHSVSTRVDHFAYSPTFNILKSFIENNI